MSLLAAVSNQRSSMRDRMISSALVCHPGTRCAAVTSLSVQAGLSCAEQLRISYRLRGEPARLSIPSRRAAVRVDGLWRHSCFELFIQPAVGGSYLEFNFSPSQEWAAYRFRDYRQGATPVDLVQAPQIECRQTDGSLDLSAEINLHGLDILTGPVRLGVSAVIESVDGTLSYWALRHVSDQPDFHHAGSFALTLAMDGT